MLSRRGFITGLITTLAAPVIVKAEILMPIKQPIIGLTDDWTDLEKIRFAQITAEVEEYWNTYQYFQELKLKAMVYPENFFMVKVRNGVKSDAKKRTTKDYKSFLCQKSKYGIVFMCSTPSKIECARFIVLLSAISRQCTLYRTLIRRTPPNAREAEELLVRWARKLPLKALK